MIRYCQYLMLLLFAACGTTPTGLTPPPPDYTVSPKVILAAGDKLDIKFFHTPELNELDLLVRPDGKVGLQLIGEVMVEGYSPREFRYELTKLYASHLKYPREITIIVKELTNRRIFVTGEVKTPGLVPLPGRLTALEAIYQTGGFDLDKARPECTVLVRQQGNERLSFLLDLQGALEGKPAAPFFLQPGDMIYVPRTKIANVDQFVDQYFHKIFGTNIIHTGILATR